jgi:non-ribosomal peptide synthetase-like protein
MDISPRDLPFRSDRPVRAHEVLEEAAQSGLLHAIFETAADTRPEAVAVIFGREEATYAALESRANRLARHLRGLGVGRGLIVAMLLPRSIDAYATLLGILKAGAAYVPIDPEYPPDRVAFILEDSGAGALVTTAALGARHGVFGGAVVRVDADREAIAACGAGRLPHREVGTRPDDLCYVIYTSGSTGRPKGVMIEHRNACHLVRAEERVYGVLPEDRVYQGASLSFDLSVEEIWMAFRTGATLVAATPEMAQAGPDLSRLLAERRVTVLSCVPTLLSMLSEDIPTLRVLILGGERCPGELVTRWARPGRRLVNTYGPTETTVIATWAPLRPGKPVTIGRPVPGYRIHLLDGDLRPVPRGSVGEICIGGPGVARGYVGLPDETRARFVPDPLAPEGAADRRMYRSGDLGRLDAEGNIEFVGRADGQVKLRGFRVELAEIESVMMQAGGVLAAACAVRQDVPGVEQLVGYVIPRDAGGVDEERLRSVMRSRLPAYMVPALIETVADLPLLPSGKLDRAALPAPRRREAAPCDTAGRPRTGTERRILAIWTALFRPQTVSRDDHFFLDLGGHSLLAARMVSELRKDPRFGRVSVADVYAHPTIASLAAALDAAPRPGPSSAPRAAVRSGFRPGERRRHFAAGLLQSIGLYFVFGFGGLRSLPLYLVYFTLVADGRSPLEAAGWAAACAVALVPCLLLAAIAAKWLVVGRVRPGRYPLWSWYYLRLWFVGGLVSSMHLDDLSGTPLLPWVFRLLGARIGKDVHIGSSALGAYDLIAIGDGSSIDEEAMLLGHTVDNGELVVGPVRVGRGCFVGTRSALGVESVMEDGARLEDLSLLVGGARIPRGETWAGSPARRVAAPHAAPPPAPVRAPFRRAATTAVYGVLALVLPFVLLAALLPGLALLTRIDLPTHPFLYLAAAPIVGASFVLFLTTEVALLKRLLVGRVRAGTYPLHGHFYVRNWVVDRLLALSLHVIGGLHATLYLAPWYRALGARLGRFVELSTATSTVPDLLDIADEATIADEVSLGAARIEGGWMTLAPTRLGRRAFLGNGAVVPGGTEMGDRTLVGVLSVAPADRREAARPDGAWLGSPPLPLPRRQPSAAFPENRTYRPTRRLWLTRAAIEILRVTLPSAGLVMVITGVVTAALHLRGVAGTGAMLLLLPILYGACSAAVLAAVVLAKWAVMGRFRPFVVPLWSPFVWRLEAVNALYEFLATPLALEALVGTPFLPWYFRLLGARIGRGVYMGTTGLIEFDLVEVGDRAAINENAVLQSHLFEDRVLKASWVRVGADCSVGAESVVLYDTEMQDGARLDAVSLLMKGETLPAGTSWTGVPAAWRDEARPKQGEDDDEREGEFAA